jgi:hypothetical protein
MKKTMEIECPVCHKNERVTWGHFCCSPECYKKMGVSEFFAYFMSLGNTFQQLSEILKQMGLPIPDVPGQEKK